MNLPQICIVIFSGSGALMINLGGRWAKWGKISCMFASPIWILSTAGGAQWGMFLMTIWVSLTYVLGVYRHWSAKDYPWQRMGIPLKKSGKPL